MLDLIEPAVEPDTSWLDERGIVSELAASNRVAQWAYAQAESAGGLTWLRADELVPLAVGWRSLF